MTDNFNYDTSVSTHQQKDANFFFGWLTDLKFREFWLPTVIRVVCMVLYIISLGVLVIYALFGTFACFALCFEVGHPAPLLLIPLIWIALVFAAFLNRLYFEFVLIFFDFIFKAREAAALYIEQNKKQ